MAKRITKKLVKDFYRYMLRKQGVSLVKRDSIQMAIISSAIDLLGVADEDDFLDSCGIAIGRRQPFVYLPFEAGVFSTARQGMVQIASLPHELHHIEQNREDRSNQGKYLLRRGHRAFQEAEAIHVEMELWHWYLPRHRFAINRAAARLRMYQLRNSDIGVVKRQLAMAKRDVERGIVTHPVSKTAIRWLIKHA
jgi:hypothetical protein